MICKLDDGIEHYTQDNVQDLGFQFKGTGYQFDLSMSSETESLSSGHTHTANTDNLSQPPQW